LYGFIGHAMVVFGWNLTVGPSDESDRLVHFTVHGRNHEWDNWTGF